MEQFLRLQPNRKITLMHLNPEIHETRTLESLYQREIEKLKFKIISGGRKSEIADQTERVLSIALALHQLNTGILLKNFH